MQATIVIPYPGTPLLRSREKGWLLTEDYEHYDMREPLMKTPFPKEKIYALEQELYSSFMTPQYIIRRVLSIRSFHDFKYFFYMAWKLLAHLLDFDPSQTKSEYHVLFLLEECSEIIRRTFLQRQDQHRR